MGLNYTRMQLPLSESVLYTAAGAITLDLPATQLRHLPPTFTYDAPQLPLHVAFEHLPTASTTHPCYHLLEARALPYTAGSPAG